MLSALRAVHGSIFKPSLMSFHCCAGGHLHTIMTMGKKWAYDAFCSYSYDHRELFTLSDGGQVYIVYKGQSFRPDMVPRVKPRNLVILVNGLTQDSSDRTIQRVVE